MKEEILYLQNQEIDRVKWDQCIEDAPNGLIYAYTDYLDALADNWDALILNDYEAVMPLPWRKKWGFKYLYQPYFAATLGIFGEDISRARSELFINFIPKKFSFWDLDLNENVKGITAEKIKKTSRKNLLIYLNSPYEIIRNSYSRLANRMIKKSSNELVLKNDTAPENIIKYYQYHYKYKHLLPSNAYENLLKVAKLATTTGNIKAYTAEFKEGEIAAFYLLLFDSKFVYSVLGGSTEKGKKYGAFYLLTDAAIREFSGTNKSFRFEGSDKSGIAFFNAQFGATLIEYLNIQKNDLPWPVSMIKNFKDKFIAFS